MKRRQAAIEERLARGQQRPDLKLKAQVVSFENGPTDVSDVKLGFEISQPLFFRDDRSDADLARIERRQVTLKKDQTRRKIRADVEGAFVDLRQSRRQVEAARERVDLARRLQEAEQRRFEVGESTLFLVNKREQDFAKARKALVAARASVARAVAEVRWATGTIADEGRTDVGRAN
jgi:outer membrane protein TolC